MKWESNFYDSNHKDLNFIKVLDKKLTDILKHLPYIPILRIPLSLVMEDNFLNKPGIKL